MPWGWVCDIKEYEPHIKQSQNLEFKNSSLLSKESLNEISWESIYRDKWAEQSWQLLKDNCLKAQEVTVP